MAEAGMASMTTIEHLGEFEGQDVTLRGWLYNLRESGKLLFPIFRDGSGVVQGVMAKNAVSRGDLRDRQGAHPGIQRNRPRQGAGRQARPRRL